MKSTNSTVDYKVNGLKPGEHVVISSGNGCRVEAERGTGPNQNIIRFVRYLQDGSWSVFKTSKLK